MAKIKVFHAEDIPSYSNFIPNRQIVDNIEDADLVVFEGGADFNPSLYGEPVGRYTHFYKKDDERVVEIFNQAKALGKPMWGTCRGLQVLAAMAGAKLVQDVDHPGVHAFNTYDGLKLMTNSLHHQMIFPFNLPKDEYEVLATAPNLSPHHTGGKEEEMFTNPEHREVEAAFFPKIKALGVQGHPEFMSMESNAPFIKWIHKEIKEKLGLDI